MPTDLTLHALVLLAGLPHFGFGPIRPAAPPDSVPPAWKPASVLAIENSFVQTSLLPSLTLWPPSRGLRISNDPRELHVLMNPDSGTVSTRVEIGEEPAAPPSQVTLHEYAREMTSNTFRRLWLQTTHDKINSRYVDPNARSYTGLQFALPQVLPQRVQSLLGPGGPALNVSGSENIKLSGESNWTNQQVGQLGTRRSLFPTLNMQQDLNIQLEGQLSDRVRVNLLQNSANQVPLANRIAINYHGEDDDLVQELDLGNTNLSLPGTQYVSYSGKNEGLFGIKSTARWGPLDFTMLASKQEGKSERASYSGASSKQQQTLYDFDYIRGTYFFLYDPNSPTPLDIDPTSIRVYRDDGTVLNTANSIQGRALVDPLRFAPGDTAVQDTASARGTFNLLVQGTDQDYELHRDYYTPVFPVIKLKRRMDGEQKLAVTYDARPYGTSGPFSIHVGGYTVSDTDTTRLVMKLLRAPTSLLQPDSLHVNFSTNPATAPFNVTRDLELKNFYQLQGQRIDLSTFKLTIRQGQDYPPVTSIAGTPIPYLEAAGLDNLDESGSTPIKGHDGKVDGTALTSGGLTIRLVDPDAGVLFFPDLRPFAPRIAAPNIRPFERLIDSLAINRRQALTGPDDPHNTSPPAPNAANPAIYDRYITVPSNDLRTQFTTYFIDVEFTAQQASGMITLGRGNILQGSDVVTVDGVAWQRDRDYTIDYDLGQVTLKRQLSPGQNLNIDYSYAPLFQQAGRTLVGSAFHWEGLAQHYGGAFMYESQGAQDLRPRIGEEPSRSLISDLNADWDFHPDWVTRAVDALPGVRTTTPSELRVQAEVGASFPNPNTANQVYIDDMEGVRDAVSLAMDPGHWRWSSVPQLMEGAGIVGSAADSLDNAEVHWYSPVNSIKEHDLKPTLTDAEGGSNPHQSLAISVPRRPRNARAPDSPLWSGLTYPLDQAGLDLSRSQFIEVWVNDFRDQHDPADGLHRVRGDALHPGIRLHIDIGQVSEDQQRAPDEPPNGILDTEDKLPRDNQLTVTPDNNEDTGYDGKLDAEEIASGDSVRDLTTAGPGDPEGDDFQPPVSDVSRDARVSLDPRSWRYTNGTEGSKNVNPTPDTEDLDLNTLLDTQNNYIEYTIDLGDTTSRYLLTDVYQNYVVDYHPQIGAPPLAATPQADNGWRLYRIPIADSLAVKFGNPNLSIVKHVRVWLQGIVTPDEAGLADNAGPQFRKPLIVLGGLDIVGNRWQQSALDSAALAGGTTLTLNTVNSVDNADRYVPPFDPGNTRNGNQEITRREQSLSLEFTHLQPGGEVEAYKTFSIDEDYSRYGKLDWFATGFDVPNYNPIADSTLDYFVRFASDELGRNYYEYRVPLRTLSTAGNVKWQEVKLTLTDLSNLKLAPNFPTVDPITFDTTLAGAHYGIHGRPSFTRLRRISVGLANHTGQVLDSGQLWFDELRAIDVAKNPDHAQRVLVNGQLANLLSYNIAWNGRGADFLSVGESRGSGVATDDINAGGTLQLNRFFEGTGINLPVSFNYDGSRQSPRFTAGDDIVRIGPLAQASVTRTDTRSFAVAYSRAWSNRANALLRYTIGGITANYSRTEVAGYDPNGINHLSTMAAVVNYTISPRKLVSLPTFLSKTRLYPLPERFYWNYSLGTNHAVNEQRFGALRDSLRLANDVVGRNAFIDFGADTRPFDLLHHHIEARRNLTLPDSLVKQDPIGRLGSINLGRVTSWRQNFDVARLPLGKGWFQPVMTWNSQYNQNNGPELSPDLSIRQVSNGQQAGITWDVPFDRFGGTAPGLPSVRDTLRIRKRGPSWWRSLAQRLGTVSTEAGFTKSSSYTRLTGTPSPLYLLGLSSDPDTSRTRTEFGNDAQQGLDWHSSVRARVQTGLGSSVSAQANWLARRADANGVVTRQSSEAFPNLSLDVDYGQAAHAILLDRLLVTPQLRTTWNHTASRDFTTDSPSPSQTTASNEWRPLIGLTGALKDGARTELRIERRSTQTENFLLGHSVTTQQTTTFNFSINRSYSKGQKVNVLGKTSTVNSNINVGLTGIYETQTGETRQDGFALPQNPVNQSRLTISTNGSYGFSTNVTGNLMLSFNQNRDRERAIVSRSVHVEVRAQFTF